MHRNFHFEMAHAQNETVRVALVGHSYIYRLDEFMKHPSRMATHRNLGFSGTEVDVRCYGLGGGRVVPGYKYIQEEINRALKEQCTIFYLHIGENDFNQWEPQVISDHLHSLISNLLQMNRLHLSV